MTFFITDDENETTKPVAMPANNINLLTVKTVLFKSFFDFDFVLNIFKFPDSASHPQKNAPVICIRAT